MASLYKISEEFKAIQSLEDMPAEAIADTLEGVVMEFQEKAVSVVMVTLNMGGDIEQIESEIDRLIKMKTVRKNAIQRLRDYLKNNMEATDISKIEHALFSITLSKPGVMVKIVDEDDIPDEYVSVETVVKPDKRRILKDLKEGKKVDGCELSDTARKLTIR